METELENNISNNNNEDSNDIIRDEPIMSKENSNVNNNDEYNETIEILDNNEKEGIKDNSVIEKNKLLDTEVFNLKNYNSNYYFPNEYENFESREDIYYPFDDDHDNDSFPSNPWIFSSDDESNLFDQDQYENEMNEIDDEQWTELYNNDEIFNFIYNDKNLFPGYFQSKEDLRIIDENNTDAYNIDDPDQRIRHEFKLKLENNKRLDQILDNYFKANKDESDNENLMNTFNNEYIDNEENNENIKNNNNTRDNKNEDNNNLSNDKIYQDSKLKFKNNNDNTMPKYLKKINVESFEKSWKKILKKYMDFKNNYSLEKTDKLENFNEKVLEKEFFVQKKEIKEKKDNLKENETLFNEITNDINDIQKTANTLLIDYVNCTIKLCEYAKKKFPELEVSDTFKDFDYNINNAYKLKVPLTNELQTDVNYRTMYINYKDKFEMLLLSKKLIDILNEKRTQIAYQLGISTLEYEKIQKFDYLVNELEKERLKEMVMISKKIIKNRTLYMFNVNKK